MNMNNLNISQGDQTITIELTMREAMALSGFRFGYNPKQVIEARRKVRKAIDSQYMAQNELPVEYEHLTH